MKRADFDEGIREIREVFPVSFRKGRNPSLAIKEIEERRRADEDVSALLEFIKSSKRGVCLSA
jgi:acyl-[acyl carrier protein]--UDP-N-acetylglucosamine O-acyltransferase